MYERILVPTDGSETVDAVLDAALDLAERDDATVHLLNVADTTRPSLTTTTGGVEDVLERAGETIVSTATERVRERGLDVVTEVRQGRPASTIVEYAAGANVDLVVMPTHGRTGVARLFLGSVTERVVRQSDVPVLTIRPDSTVTIPVETVLVPTDGSAAAAAAVETASEVALEHGAALELLHVIDTASLGPDVGSYVDIDRLEANAETVLGEAAEMASAAGVGDVGQTVEYGTPHREIRRFVAENDVHLVVMGTQGLTGFDRYLLGSVAEKVLRTASVPVMTVRGSDEE
jgi:nucleotide-binding universal stress UspA family protein